MERLHHFLFVGISTLFWTIIHSFVNDRFCRSLLPSVVVDIIENRKKKDETFRRTCEANGTAFLHSVLITPTCLYLGLKLLKEDPWEAESDVFEFFAIVMLGYFVWDTLICMSDIKVYGGAFLLHALLSLTGMYVQVISTRCRMIGFTAMFAASEISTPSLHLRWFCLKAKYTKSLFFRLSNIVFLITFVCFRMICLPIFVFPIYWLDCFSSNTHTYNMSSFRKYYQLIITLLWVCLNYYWGALLLTSQVKNLFGNQNKEIADDHQTEKKKELVSNGELKKKNSSSDGGTKKREEEEEKEEDKEEEGGIVEDMEDIDDAGDLLMLSKKWGSIR